MVETAEGSTETVRVLCGFGPGRVDEDQDRSERCQGAVVRQQFPLPVLIVSDLKHSDREGAVALWIGLGTEGCLA
jgi:hypothetical protein